MDTIFQQGTIRPLVPVLNERRNGRDQCVATAFCPRIGRGGALRLHAFRSLWWIRLADVAFFVVFSRWECRCAPAGRRRAEPRLHSALDVPQRHIGFQRPSRLIDVRVRWVPAAARARTNEYRRLSETYPDRRPLACCSSSCCHGRWVLTSSPPFAAPIPCHKRGLVMVGSNMTHEKSKRVLCVAWAATVVHS